MTVQWDQPFSTNVSRVGHDPDTDTMFVEWNNGRISVYAGVPFEKYEQVRKSPSVTAGINSEIKPSHKHSYLPRQAE